MDRRKIRKLVEDIRIYSNEAGMAQACLAEGAADIHNKKVDTLKQELFEELGIDKINSAETPMHIQV